MKRIHLIMILLLTASAVSAVTESEARRVAASFIRQHRTVLKTMTRSTGAAPDGIVLETVAGTPQDLHAFNGDGGGFVLVSACGTVIGYADSGALDWRQVPEALKDWTAVLAGESLATTVTRASGATATAIAHAAVAPMLTTTWHQTAPYNALCPEGTVTGCVATAMAQVMNYHRWPQDECGAIAAYGSHEALAPTTFDWQQMRTAYSADDPADAYAPVAQLMRYCGRAVQTVYSAASLAYEFRIPMALSGCFGYDASVRRVVRSDYGIAEWDAMIYGEMAAGRPVIYSGQRTQGTVHEFVIDGCDSLGYYHVNWGWGGQGDGYFLLPALIPGETSTGGGSGYDGYTMDQSAVIGIMPDGGGAAPTYGKTLTVEDFGLMSDTTVYHRERSDEPFTVLLRCVQGNHANKALGCYPGIGLYEGSRRISVTGGSFTTYDPGAFTGKHWDGIYRYVPSQVTFGAGMTGSYRLLPVCGTGGLVMVSWQPSTGADSHYVEAELTETTLTLTEHPRRVLRVTAVSLEGEPDGVMTGRATVANDGDEFNGRLYLQVNGALATATGAAIAAGETAEVTFHFFGPGEVNGFRIGFWPEGNAWLCEGQGTQWELPTDIGMPRAGGHYDGGHADCCGSAYRLDGSRATGTRKGLTIRRGRKAVQ